MTPEKLAQASEIIGYATDQLRNLELEHKADPGAIFAELLTRLVEAEFKVQAVKSELGEAEEGMAQFSELVLAIWGNQPVAVTHEQTLARVRALCLLDPNHNPSPPEEDGTEPHYAGAQPDGAETEPPEGD